MEAKYHSKSGDVCEEMLQLGYDPDILTFQVLKHFLLMLLLTTGSHRYLSQYSV